MIRITFTDANDIVVSLALDDTDYKMRMLWNKQAGSWSMHLLDRNSEPLLTNIRVVPNFPLLMNHHISAEIPQGEFVVVTDKTEVGRSDFADESAKLYYLTREEAYGG